MSVCPSFTTEIPQIHIEGFPDIIPAGTCATCADQEKCTLPLIQERRNKLHRFRAANASNESRFKAASPRRRFSSPS